MSRQANFGRFATVGASYSQSFAYSKRCDPCSFSACASRYSPLSRLALGIPIIDEFIHTKRVARFPTAILAVSIQIVAFLSLAAGAILRSVASVRDEVRQMMYLQIPAPDAIKFSVPGEGGPGRES